MAHVSDIAKLEVLQLEPAAAATTTRKTKTTIENADCNKQTNIEICRKAAKDLIYNEFYWTYMQRNWPIIITDIATEWECYRNWVIRNISNNENNNDQGKPTSTAINFDYLRKKIGNCRVPVADCTTEYFNSHAKREMDFYDFLADWQAKVEGTDNNKNSKSTMNTKLYLKDWHLKTVLPDYDFYRVPKQFASDWLNEQLVAKGYDDYRFVYMGPKDTWTPFHADVFGSFSWSTNIVGCKKWLLLPPGEEIKLSDRLGNLPFRIDEKLLEKHQVRYFTLLQAENEAIFVPSGWYHQVWNITDTISVNHNWFNACNLKQIWQNLQSNMVRVIAAIEDCRQMDNFDAHCQTVLRASFGLNYLDFIEHLDFIINQRVTSLTDRYSDSTIEDQDNDLESSVITSSKFILFDTYILNKYHEKNDLKSIRSVLELMLQDKIICDNRTEFYRECLLLNDIIKVHYIDEN